jgi:hypothetical protein
MWSGSPLKFEHSQHPPQHLNHQQPHPAQQQQQHQQHQQQQQQHGQGQGQQGQDTEFNNFHMPPQAMPSTPTHHRRGQSLSAIPNLPRTPNHHPLRPPVFLHSPMQRTNSTGLVGVGDVFAPNSFEDNMGAFLAIGPRRAWHRHRHAAAIQLSLTIIQHTTHRSCHPALRWRASTRN